MDMKFQEITKDNGCAKVCNASNNNAEYILKSAYAKDCYAAFVRKYDRLPSSSWYNRNFSFERK